MFAFAIRMIRDKYKAFIAYSLAALAFLEMYIALFPSIQQQSAGLDKIIASFPPAIFKAVNMDPSTLSFSKFEPYLSTEYLSFLWPIMMIIFAISIANYISVNEIDKGTIETLISLPVSRVKIFVQRYFTGLLMIAIFSVVSMLGALPLAKLHGVSFVLNNFITATIGSFLFAWAVYSLAMLFSVLFSEKGKASMASGGVLILMYVIYIVSTLKDNLKNVQYASFFHYFSGSELLAKNAFPDYSIIIFTGFAVIVFVVSLLIFRRRDLSV